MDCILCHTTSTPLNVHSPLQSPMHFCIYYSWRLLLITLNKKDCWGTKAFGDWIWNPPWPCLRTVQDGMKAPERWTTRLITELIIKMAQQAALMTLTAADPVYSDLYVSVVCFQPGEKALQNESRRRALLHFMQERLENLTSPFCSVFLLPRFILSNANKTASNLHFICVFLAPWLLLHLIYHCSTNSAPPSVYHPPLLSLSIVTSCR